MFTVSPLMKEEPSNDKRQIGCATSCAVPSLRTGIASTALHSFSSVQYRIISVMAACGAMALQVMANGP